MCVFTHTNTRELRTKYNRAITVVRLHSEGKPCHMRPLWAVSTLVSGGSGEERSQALGTEASSWQSWSLGCEALGSGRS